MDEYYVFDGKMQHGPFSLLQLQSMWRSGSITPLMLYTQPGLEEWTPLSELAEILRPPQRHVVPARLRAVSQKSGNPPNWAFFVVMTILFPLVGFITGIRWLCSAEYRGAGSAIIAIAFVVTFLYAFVLPNVLHSVLR